jgi:phosphotransferase system HPr-like phosphotransfer protein
MLFIKKGNDIMTNLKIQLTSIADVQKFVNAVTRFNGDVDLQSGRYLVDAKSIMGIFSLDLTQPVDMLIHSDNVDELIKDIDAFIVK